MEEVNAVEHLVSSLGVPVALLIFVCCFLVYMWEKNREDRQKNDQKWQELFLSEQEKHKQEVDKITEALNNNTLAITKLAMLLSEKESEVEENDS